MDLMPYVIRWDGQRHDRAVAGNEDKEAIFTAAREKGYLRLQDDLICVTEAGLARIREEGYFSDAMKIEARMKLREARLERRRQREAVVQETMRETNPTWGTW